MEVVQAQWMMMHCWLLTVWLFLLTVSIHVVFGHVLQGQEVISEIENQRVDDKSRPLVDVKIGNCGELIPKTKAKGKKFNALEKVKYSRTLI